MAVKNFWENLLPHTPSNISYENGSLDVALKNCFGNYDTTACVRNSFLTSLGLGSALLCIIRIVKLHIFHHPQIHQYLLFYLASLEIICLILKWMALESWYQLEFVASDLKMFQFIILCHFYWSLASRILHQQNIIKWVILPLLFGFLSFYSCVVVLGLMIHFTSWDECLAPHWILLSFSEFLGIQLYLAAGIYIHKKINSVSAMDSFKCEQKRDLWSVIVTYEISSIVTVSYYSILQLMGDCESGCSGIFAHSQEIYSPVYTTIMVIKYLGPIWIMLFIFYPTRGALSSEEEKLLGWSYDGSSTSTFSPILRFQDSYRQLLIPVEIVNNSVSHEYPIIRRSASSPAFYSKSPLTPIYEDRDLPAPVVVPNYGTMGASSSHPEKYNPPRTRRRHDSGTPAKHDVKGKKIKVVSLNPCSGEMESVTPSSVEQA